MRVALSVLLAAAAVAISCGDDRSELAPPADGGAPVDAASESASVADAGDAAATPPLPLHPSAGKDEDPSLLRKADGTYLLAWYSNRDGADRVFVTSSADGVAWSPPRAITAPNVHAFYPSLAQSKDGRFHLVFWQGDVGDGGALVGSIRYASSDDTLVWTEPVALSDAASLSWTPTITARGDGELFVAWSSNAGGVKDVYVLGSTNGGASWTAAPTRLADPSFNDDIPVIVARPDGTLVMLWQRYAPDASSFGAPFEDSSNEIVYATSPDGVSWTTPLPLTSDPPGAPVPDVIGALFPSSDPSGLSAAWTSVRAGSAPGDVFALGLSAGPAPSANPTKLTTEPGADYSARLAPTDEAGRYLMVWVSAEPGREPELRQRFVRP